MTGGDGVTGREAGVLAPEIVPYLDACARGVLAVPRCARCGRRQWPPRPRCRSCGHDELGWTEVPGRGSLYSWTTTHRAPSPAFAPLTPYTVVIVTLDVPEEVRMVGRLKQTRTVPDLTIGDPMVASFEPAGDGQALVVWSPR